MKTSFDLKKVIITILLTLSEPIYSQVGINNNDPKSTLDVTAKTTDGSKPEGFIAPRLTGDQIKSANSQYSNTQQGTIVYATSGISSADATGKSSSILAPGYYYFDGSMWRSIGGKVTADNGLTNNGNNIQLGGVIKQSTIISGVTATNNLAVTGTGANAINLASNTISIDATNNRLGVGNTSPRTALDVAGAAVNSNVIIGGNNVIDFSGSNIATTAGTSDFTLNNLRSGGAYTLVCTATTATTLANFITTGFTPIYMGTSTRIAGKQTIYSIIVTNGNAYITMAVQN